MKLGKYDYDIHLIFTIVGNLFYRGTILEDSQEAALSFYQAGLYQQPNSYVLCCRVGQCFESGIGLSSQNIDWAQDFYQASCEILEDSGAEEGVYVYTQWGKLHLKQNEKREADGVFLKAASVPFDMSLTQDNDGCSLNMEDIISVAEMNAEGYGVKRNLQEAKNLYIKAYEKLNQKWQQHEVQGSYKRAFYDDILAYATGNNEKILDKFKSCFSYKKASEMSDKDYHVFKEKLDKIFFYKYNGEDYFNNPLSCYMLKDQENNDTIKEYITKSIQKIYSEVFLGAIKNITKTRGEINNWEMKLRAALDDLFKMNKAFKAYIETRKKYAYVEGTLSVNRFELLNSYHLLARSIETVHKGTESVAPHYLKIITFLAQEGDLWAQKQREAMHRSLMMLHQRGFFAGRHEF